MGKDGAMFTPNELAFTFRFFWRKSIKKCERESARRRTHGQRQAGVPCCML